MKIKKYRKTFVEFRKRREEEEEESFSLRKKKNGGGSHLLHSIEIDEERKKNKEYV